MWHPRPGARRAARHLTVVLTLSALSCRTTPPPSAVGTTVVIVVRHAEKDTVPKGNPPLTPAGVARANALASALADANVEAVVTTELLRTQQTAQPLAAARHLTPVVVPHGTNVAQHASAVAAAVRGQAGKTMLVVGHAETVGPIISALGGPAIGDLCGDEYSNLYTLVLSAGARPARLIRSTYGAPSPPHTTPCQAAMKR